MIAVAGPLSRYSVPHGWSVEPFGRITERRRDAGRPDLEPLSVFLHEGVVPRASREDNFNRLGADLGKYLVVHPGDIVFNKLRTWQGGLGISRHQGIVSPAYFVCRPRDSVEPRFLDYLLRSSLYLNELTRISKWMPPSQFDISWDDLKLLPTLLPPLPIQRSIADLLDAETARIDALIEKKQQMVRLLEAREQILAAEWLNSLHDGAMSVPLRWFVKVRSGESPPEGEGVIPAIGGNGIAGYATSANISECVIVVGRVGALCGNVHVVEPPAWVTDNALIVRISKGFVVQYLAEVLRALDLNRIANQTAQPLITGEQVKSLRVPQPSLDEQLARVREFLAARDAARRPVVELERQIALLAEKRNALITAAVTGELARAEAA